VFVPTSYEASHAPAVARVLAARLARARGAAALLVCPVRCSATVDAFVAFAAAAGLQATRAPLAGGEGAERYEGGYARIEVRWAEEGVEGVEGQLARTHIQA
jgi:hypothetical protein